MSDYSINIGWQRAGIYTSNYVNVMTNNLIIVSWSDGIIVTESLVVEWPLIPIVNASGVCA